MAGPGKERISLGYDPVGCAVKVKDREGRVGGLGGDEGGDGSRRRDALV